MHLQIVNISQFEIQCLRNNLQILQPEHPPHPLLNLHFVDGSYFIII